MLLNMKHWSPLFEQNFRDGMVPPKGRAQARWLERSEAAQSFWAAWRLGANARQARREQAATTCSTSRPPLGAHASVGRRKMRYSQDRRRAHVDSCHPARRDFAGESVNPRFLNQVLRYFGHATIAKKWKKVQAQPNLVTPNPLRTDLALDRTARTALSVRDVRLGLFKASAG